MIRIERERAGSTTRGCVTSLRRAAGPARAAAARAVVDALAIEVDGVDIAAGQAEGALLPSLEALLRAIARIIGGEAHATVPFREGELELVIRRRGRERAAHARVALPPLARARARRGGGGGGARSRRRSMPRRRSAASSPSSFPRKRSARDVGCAPPHGALRRAEAGALPRPSSGGGRGARSSPGPGEGAASPARSSSPTTRGTSSRTKAAGPIWARCSSPGA